ncbi:MAG: hypothetical protein AAF658_14825 [Myxococcota bacterium]
MSWTSTGVAHGAFSLDNLQSEAQQADAETISRAEIDAMEPSAAKDGLLELLGDRGAIAVDSIDNSDGQGAWLKNVARINADNRLLSMDEINASPTHSNNGALKAAWSLRTKPANPKG